MLTRSSLRGLASTLTGVGVLMLAIGCKRAPSQEAMKREPHVCPPGTRARIEPWSDLGWIRSCESYEGPFVLWDGSGKRGEGTYEHDQKVGTWLWYDASGRLRRTEHYEHGRLVSFEGERATTDP